MVVGACQLAAVVAQRAPSQRTRRRPRDAQLSRPGAAQWQIRNHATVYVYPLPHHHELLPNTTLTPRSCASFAHPTSVTSQHGTTATVDVELVIAKPKAVLTATTIEQLVQPGNEAIALLGLTNQGLADLVSSRPCVCDQETPQRYHTRAYELLLYPLQTWFLLWDATQQPTWASVEGADHGVLAPGDTQMLQFNNDARGLEAGSYTTTVTLLTNDPTLVLEGIEWNMQVSTLHVTTAAALHCSYLAAPYSVVGIIRSHRSFCTPAPWKPA